MPVLVVVGGPNGSGKTTLTKYLISRGRIKSSVINPDEIASKELGSYQNQIQASKIALARRREAIAANTDIAFETTFSGNSEIREIIDAKAAGYTTILYFVALQSPLDNVIRVEERHNQLGHDVNTEDVIRRISKSVENLQENLHLFDTAYLFDNSGVSRSRVAIFNSGKLVWANKKHFSHNFYKALLSSFQ